MGHERFCKSGEVIQMLAEFFGSHIFTSRLQFFERLAALPEFVCSLGTSAVYSCFLLNLEPTSIMLPLPYDLL